MLSERVLAMTPATLPAKACCFGVQIWSTRSQRVHSWLMSSNPYGGSWQRRRKQTAPWSVAPTYCNARACQGSAITARQVGWHLTKPCVSQ